MQTESGSYFWIVLAALIAAGLASFRLVRRPINRLTKWIVNHKWRKS